MTFQFQIKNFTILLLAVSLIACGSDDSSSTTAPAQIEITTTNVQNLALATAVTSTITYYPSRNGALPDHPDITTRLLTALGQDNLDGIKCPSTSGSYSVALSAQSASVSFQNFCLLLLNTDRAFINGTIQIPAADTATADDFVANLNDFSIEAEAQGVKLIFNCTVTGVNSVISHNCYDPSVASVNSYVTGVLTQLDQINLTGDGEIGYMLTGRLNSPDGYVQIETETTNPLYFGCANDAPSAGMISIIGSNGSSATANFSDGDADCFTYELCLYQQNVLVSCDSVLLPGVPQ